MINPIKASQNIKEAFISYISTSYMFADNDLRKQFESQLGEIISKGPYLETNDSFTKGKSISELIGEGVLSPLFLDLESKKDGTQIKKVLPLDRPLYLHQEKAIRSISEGKNAVISTGTGSGKTNCFLIPVINDLLREKEEGTLGSGVRALFIYPMNALANDQLKNIRKILMDYEDISFGVYSGNTEQDEADAIKVYEAMFSNEPVEKLRHPLKNEFISREKMKESPPNILFTNYAMLEHLLFRPKDDVLFSKSDFKFVVLDEAHVYCGATGIETAILLRRLKARIASSRDTQFILTSATLGSDERSDDDIVTFARNLCGVDFDKGDIIRAIRETYIYNPNGNDYPLTLIRELSDESNIVSKVLDKYGILYNSNDEAEILYDFLNSSRLYHNFRLSVEKVSSVTQIKERMGLTESDCTAFISLCSRANKNGNALIDARYHFFVRSLEGCFATLSHGKQLFLNRRQMYYDHQVFEIAICDECGRYGIIGKIQDNHLVQANKYDENIEYFALAEDINPDIDDEMEGTNDTDEFVLCLRCGALVEKDRIKNKPCDCDSNDYINVVRVKKKNSASDGYVSKCCNCRIGKYKRFYLGNDAATAVLATSLYEELPEVVFEEPESSTTKTNVFARAAARNKKTAKKTGRQFLVFSDSRQEAAKFACYLGKSYDEFLRRRGICHIVEAEKKHIIEGTYTISDFVSLLTSYYSNMRSFAESNSDSSNLTQVSKKNAWVAMLNELARFNSPTSLTALGVLQFEYLGNTNEIIDSVAKSYDVDFDSVRNLLNLLVLEIIKAGAICTDTDTDIGDSDRDYIFYSPRQRFITRLQAPEKRLSTVSSWMPRNKKDKTDVYYKTNKLVYVMNYLQLSEKEAADFLEDYFNYLVDPSIGNDYCMIDINRDGTFVLPAKYFRVRVCGDAGINWYKCSKCGKVSPYNFRGKCVITRCKGNVDVIRPEDIRTNNHFSNLYFSDRMTPLFIKEHTAQLSKKESAEYQEQFIKKEINALSCSTTFEMGVDVGDLETVLLRDVPPLPSNYAQRAGRAGRSINAAAYCLTFAKLSSHDLSFFKEPEKMINGVIMPPLFKIDNEKIVRRHIYAVALSMFFALHPEQYHWNNADLFINEKGYLEFLTWLDSKPQRLVDMLKRSIPDIDNLHERLKLDSFGWLEDFKGEEGTFTVLIREYENNVAVFDGLIKNFKKANDLEKAARCEKRKLHYMNNRLIDFLSRGNILPRYGFPVDTVELEQNTTAANINHLRLSRDLSIAIAEYAPSSEVVADGKLYTSRYIKKTSVGKSRKEWKTAFLGICKNECCQATNYSITPVTKTVKCSCCGSPLEPFDYSESIEPVSGFVTEREAKEVPLTRQEKNYRSEDVYIGNTESKTIDSFSIEINGIKIAVESTTNDSLLVKTYNNFYVCSKCGYALAEDESIPGDKSANALIKNGAHKITTTKKHESLYGQYDCDCVELTRYSMHHVFNTDVAKIGFECDTSDYSTMISAMYAILYAISDNFNIERRDIKACLSWKVVNRKMNYSIIVYDAVPGGAGHSRRLATNDGVLLKRVIEIALNNMQGCSCKPSCYNCLRSYENQRIHDLLDRNKAIRFLSQFVDN